MKALNASQDLLWARTGLLRVAFLSLPVSGHVNPMTALARKYQARGNEVVFLSLPDVAPFVRLLSCHLCHVRRMHILKARLASMYNG